MYSSLTQILILGGLYWSCRCDKGPSKFVMITACFLFYCFFWKCFLILHPVRSRKNEFLLLCLLIKVLFRALKFFSAAFVVCESLAHQVAKCKESCVRAPCIGCVSDAHICEVHSPFVFVFPSCPLPLSSLF